MSSVNINSIRVPAREFFSDTGSSHIHSLVNFRRGVVSGRHVLGFRLPAFQRHRVWDIEQSRAFIDSVYRGRNIGCYVFNISMNDDMHDLLIDGQQRMSAIQDYVNDVFGIAGEDGVMHMYSELTQGEQASFLRISFPYLALHIDDMDKLKDAYTRMNFAGTHHVLK